VRPAYDLRGLVRHGHGGRLWVGRLVVGEHGRSLGGPFAMETTSASNAKGVTRGHSQHSRSRGVSRQHRAGPVLAGHMSPRRKRRRANQNLDSWVRLQGQTGPGPRPRQCPLRPWWTSLPAGPPRTTAEMGRATCPAWASGCDDVGTMSDGWRMLTGDGDEKGGEESASVSPWPRCSHGSSDRRSRCTGGRGR